MFFLKNLLFIKYLFTLLVIFNSNVYAFDLITLTEQESVFLEEHPTITLGTESDWGPYVITNVYGELVGYDAEVLALINQVSGANFVLKKGKWKEITEAQKNREIDGLSTAAKNAERAIHSNFSDPYITLKKMIFTRKDLPYRAKTLADLNDKTFGVYEGNVVSRSFANTLENVNIVEFESVPALLDGVATGKVDFMLGNSAMYYQLKKNNNSFLKPAFSLDSSPLELVFVIRKDFPHAITIINKALKIIGEEKLLQLKKKWFSSEVINVLAFEAQEVNYLKEKKQINLCIDPNWMPFEQLKNGKHVGISADYFDLFQQELSIPIKLVRTQYWQQTITFAKQRKCDLISLAMPTASRKTYLNFSDIILKTPVVLATKPGVTFIDNLHLIGNKKIGIIQDYAFDEVIRQQYPNIEVINVKDAQQGLQMVINDELFGYIDALATVGYLFQTKFTGELQISGKIDDGWEMSVAVRNDSPILLGIINKLIQHIPPKKHQDIFNHYVSINYKPVFDYTLFWRIMLGLLIASLFFFYRFRMLTAYNQRIERYLTVIDDNVLTTSSDPKGNITMASHALCKLSGYKKEELMGRNHTIFRHPKTDPNVYRALWAAISQEKPWQGELLNLNKNGSSYWASIKITPSYYANGQLRGYTAIHQNISDKKRLEKLAITDTLTQIPNRLFINNSFDNEFERSKRYHNHFSVILIDVDLFKLVNDNYGHNIGDEVLINIATILKQNIRQLDLLGRWGGEEFLLICPETNLLQAKIVAEKIREIIEQFKFPGVPQVTCSFGVAQSRAGDIKETIFHRADSALYAAKDAGRNQVHLEK